MTDEAALLAAVLARPEADTPRLVYADWLDDQDAEPCGRCGGRTCVYGPKIHRDGCDCGTVCHHCSGRGWVPSGAAERAEFIQVQVELARTPLSPVESIAVAKRVQWLQGRERDLLKGHNFYNWASPIPELVGQNLWAPNGPEDWEFRRGFVDDLRVPTLATLFGGDCMRCQGDGYESEGVGGECYDCRGTGATPGIAAAVFAAHPVLGVAVANLEPRAGERDGQPSVFAWCYRSGNDPGGSFLPWEVFRRLRGGRPDELLGTQMVVYDSLAAALTALSRAVVDLGRSRAGLGPVGWEPVEVPT